MNIAVLVGVARHPVTQLPCRGRDDAVAVELALRIAAAQGKSLQLIHSGSSDEPTLRFYFGMGVEHIMVLPQGADLAAYLQEQAPSLIVTGNRSGFGSGEGMLPYRIAAACHWPLIPAAVDAQPFGNGWSVSQHRPRGARRIIRTSGVTVLTAGEGGPQPRQPAFAKMRAGKVEAISRIKSAPAQQNAATWNPRPARHRPVASTTAVGSASDRRRALLEPRAISAGPMAARLVADRPVSEMARELLQQLELLGVREPSSVITKPGASP